MDGFLASSRRLSARNILGGFDVLWMRMRLRVHIPQGVGGARESQSPMPDGPLSLTQCNLGPVQPSRLILLSLTRALKGQGSYIHSTPNTHPPIHPHSRCFLNAYYVLRSVQRTQQ
jgi:hypothetical protein